MESLVTESSPLVHFYHPGSGAEGWFGDSGTL